MEIMADVPNTDLDFSIRDVSLPSTTHISAFADL